MTTDTATPLAGLPAARGTETMVCNCHVLRQAARRATALYDAAMAPYGLRISQYALLNRLLRAGGMSVQALAAEMGVDRTTLGRNLRPLERDGLVASDADRVDRRIRRLVITPEGEARVRSAAPAWHAAQAAFEQGFGQGESAALRTTLRQLIEALPPAA